MKGHKFEQDIGVGDGKGSLVYCSPWGGRELDITEQLNNKCGEKRCVHMWGEMGVWKDRQCVIVLVPLCVESWVCVLRVRWILWRRHICVQRDSCGCAK